MSLTNKLCVINNKLLYNNYSVCLDYSNNDCECKGATGPTGLQGVIGFTGPAGLQGVTGNDGATGPTGLQGVIGFTGPVGLQGVTGNDGETGPTGLQGVIGFTGPTGFTGPAGLQGVTGNDGATGPTGLQGVTGNDGATGPTGSQGIIGFTGPTGSQGIIGFTGPTGIQGLTGNDGHTGPTGPIGPTGVSNYAGTNYRDTTSISFLQNNGTVFYKASSTGSLGSIPNYNELSSVLNVPNINLSYISIIYAFVGTPAGTGTTSSLNFGLIDMSGNIISSTLLPLSSSTNIDNPSIVQYNIYPAISTLTARCLRIGIWGSNISGSNYVNIRLITIGYN